MPGLLDGLDPQMLQALMGQMQAQNVNPMERPVAGSEYLQGLGQLPMEPDVYMPQMMGQEIPTDFAGMAPGLPNLPDSFSGFGYGQQAPEMRDNMSRLRDQLIQQLIGQTGALGGI